MIFLLWAFSYFQYYEYTEHIVFNVLTDSATGESVDKCFKIISGLFPSGFLVKLWSRRLVHSNT